MNVLILSASRKVSLIRAFQRALAEEDGGRVLAADVDPRAPSLYLADGGRLVPRSDDQEFVPFLRALCARDSIDLVVPTRDEELPLLAEHRDAFAATETRVLVPRSDVVRTCQDKSLFLDFCAAEGFGAPRTYDSSMLGREEAFPVFVKPRFGKGGRGATRVESPAELELVLRRVPDAIVQEEVVAPEYTIDLFRDFDGRAISAVPRERVSIFGGESFVSRTRNHPALVGESVRLADALDLTGHATIQAFFDEDTVRFIEVNPRYGGAANLGFAAGAPTPHFLVRLLLNRPVEPRLGRFRDGLVMMRYTDDLFLDTEELLGGGS